MRAGVLAFALVVASSCGVLESLRPGPTVAPLISAAFLTVRITAGESGDGQERQRLPGLRDAIAGALPSAWDTATRGLGKLAIRTDSDIEVLLDGSNGTSALTQHSRGGKVTSRSITVHTVDGSRRLTIPELMATTLHELGHIWCCFGPGTSGGHWTDPPAAFSAVGMMYSPMRCEVRAGSDPICPSVFSDRELSAMGLAGQ